jgi:hypothetical protein
MPLFLIILEYLHDCGDQQCQRQNGGVEEPKGICVKQELDSWPGRKQFEQLANLEGTVVEVGEEMEAEDGQQLAGRPHILQQLVAFRQIVHILLLVGEQKLLPIVQEKQGNYLNKYNRIN